MHKDIIGNYTPKHSFVLLFKKSYIHKISFLGLRQKVKIKIKVLLTNITVHFRKTFKAMYLNKYIVMYIYFLPYITKKVLIRPLLNKFLTFESSCLVGTFLKVTNQGGK